MIESAFRALLRSLGANLGQLGGSADLAEMDGSVVRRKHDLGEAGGLPHLTIHIQTPLLHIPLTQ